MRGTKATAPQPLPGESRPRRSVRSRRSRPQTQLHPAPDHGKISSPSTSPKNEIEGRKVRNHMRRMRFLFKGAEPKHGAVLPLDQRSLRTRRIATGLAATTETASAA